ncbi:hypothetical protein ACRRVB_02545 [Candidatus Cardinium hertigii]|uniref:hypothetical protein n=1 Tax=Candidatus Cardinium hertigii TaxID=247481 RepID=UPI003D7D5556
MKKTIQKLTKLVALSVYLVAHDPVFAAPLQANETEQGGFFDVNKESPLHFGVKSFIKSPVKHIQTSDPKLQAFGLEGGLGPFIEWKPLNGIGIQIGVLYSHNRLFVCNKGILMLPCLFSTDKNMMSFKSEGWKFHALSIPLSVRFYPGDSKEGFALHAGVRYVIPIGKTKSYEFEKGDRPIFAFLLGNKAPQYKQNIENHLTLDFGFDYTSTSGLIMGMNGLGFQLGYDFSKLLVQP